MKQVITITKLLKITPDVIRVTASKPEGISFVPGQAADISINMPGWEDKLRAFTFTSLPTDDYLEFTIKTYPDRKGVTHQLLTLQIGDKLIIHGIFGDIHYKGEGIFIAGGAGIPLLSRFLNRSKRKIKLGITSYSSLIKHGRILLMKSFFKSF